MAAAELPRNGARSAPASLPAVRRPASPSRPPVEGVSGPEQKVLDALAWWEAVGIERPERHQVAMVAGYHERTKGFLNALGALRSLKLIDYQPPGEVVALPVLFPSRLAGVR